MAKMITYADLDAALLKPFKDDTRDLIKMALRLGWTANPSGRSFTLKSYDERATIHLSRSPRNNSGPLRQLKEKVLRHADPLLMAITEGELVSAKDPNLPKIIRTPAGATRVAQYKEARKYTAVLPEHVKATLRDWEPEDVARLIADIDRHGIALSDHLAALLSGQDVDMAAVRQYLIETVPEAAPKPAVTFTEPEPAAVPLSEAPSPEPEDVAVPVTTTPERVLVSEGPYLSHYTKGNGTDRPGKRYESPIIVERKWSDDTIDYACSFCQRQSDTPGGVISHYKKHTNAGEVEKLGSSAYRAGVASLVDDHAYTENALNRQYAVKLVEEEVPVEVDNYKPREDRVAALAAEILKMIKDANGSDPSVLATKLARKALMWVHEQKGSGVSKPPETAEEVLEAIRSLVDRGSYATLQERAETAEKARHEAEIAAAEAREQAYEAQQRAEVAEEKVLRRSEDLRAAVELVKSLGTD